MMKTMKSTVSMQRAVALSLMVLFSLSIHASAETMTLWGKQTAGSGHAKNAKTEGNKLVLTAPATIIAVEGDAEQYSIWSVVTPQNRNARAVLSGGKGRPDIVGKTLGPGSYSVIPGVEGKSVAQITIKLE